MCTYERTLRIQRMTWCPVLGSCLSFMSGFLSSALYRRLCKCRRDFFHHLLHGNMQSILQHSKRVGIRDRDANRHQRIKFMRISRLNRPPMTRSMLLFQFFPPETLFFFKFRWKSPTNNSHQPIFYTSERKIVERFPIRERDRWEGRGDDLASSKIN